jgi:hypothetical protein
MHTNFCSGFEDPPVDGRVILKTDIKETGREDVDWIRLAQDRNQ